MISMDFLTKNKVGGLEFIEFQSTDFYRKLTEFLETQIDANGILSKDSHKGILDIIAEYTGFKNINIVAATSGNFSVDVAYFSPNNVFNSEHLDTLLKTTQTTLYRWFTQNSEKVFKGSIDYKTGKVGGSFQTLPITMNINHDLNHTFPSDKIAKYGIPLAGVLAGCLAHEMGHPFGACMMMLTACSDNMLAKAAIRFYQESPREEDRVVVLQDISAILDLDKGKIADLQKLAKDEDIKTPILYFNKMVSQRNTKRALSVGVERMSSEVVADMYAIRMGCDKGVIAAISILADHGCIQTILSGILAATVQTILVGLFTLPSLASAILVGVPGSVLMAGGFLIFTTLFVFDYFGRGYAGTYNADHRRFEDAMRQLITKFKEDKRLDAKTKQDIIKQVNELLELNEKFKPWYDSTVIHRMFGWAFSGGDFRAQEMEHYTNVLANHEINLLPSQLKALA